MKDLFGTISTQRHQLSHHFTQDDVWQYIRVPFQVPEHAQEIRVSSPLPTPGRHDTIDLAIEEPGGTLRGATGGARKEIILSSKYSTPGYRVGDLPAGEWALVLGCYQLSPAPIIYDFTVEITTGKDLLFVGDLHCHTDHSDGDLSVAELSKLAKDCGLDFVAITDHNNSSAHSEIPRSPEVIMLRGQEITWYEGHFNVYGFSENPSPNYTRGDFYDQLRYARERAKVVATNHPTLPHCGLRLNPYRTMGLVNAFEAWNGSMSTWNMAAIEMWEELLKQGIYLPLIAGSDFHHKRDGRLPGTPSSWLLADSPSEESLVDAISRGRLIASKNAWTPALLPWVEEANERKFPGDTTKGKIIHLSHIETEDWSIEGITVELHTEHGLHTSFPFPDEEITVSWPEDARYVWFRLKDQKELVGITNPLRRT